MENKVYEVVAKTFSITKESINAKTGPSDILSWDSLGHMTLVSSF